jgi:hydrogenase expression/formation protein HypE
MSDKIKMQLQCPMPDLDYDIITLGHGSGGKLTNRLLEKTVFEVFNNDEINTRHDGALLKMNGNIVFSTDSFVVSPIFFPGGDIGELAVNGTVNDVAMCGGIPKYLSLSFIIEEGMKMKDFWNVLIGVKYACDKAGVQIVTGDTKVVERGKGDKIFINTTGIGELHPNADIRLERVKKGDKIIVSGNIATHGISILSVRRGLEFESDIESDTCNLNHTVITLLNEFGQDIHLMRDPTRGGVASTLNELSRDSQMGFDLKECAMPIDGQVASACEMLGLDPLYVANEGVFIAIVEASRADQILNKLRTLEFGNNSAIIGEVVDDHPGKVIIESKIGGKRVVHMAVGEQLPRIC